MENLPEVGSHRVTFVMPFSFSAEGAPDIHRRLINNSATNFVPEFATKKPYSEHTAVWRVSKFPADKEFHEHVGNILNGTLAVNNTKEGLKEGFLGLPSLALSPEAIKILNGEFHNLSLEVNPSKRAAKRLDQEGQQIWLPLKFIEVRMVFLGTEVGAVVATVQYTSIPKKAPQPQLRQIIELTSALSRISSPEDIRWSARDGSEALRVAGFEELLKKICHPMFNPCSRQAVKIAGSRDNLFTFSAVVVNQAFETKEVASETALRLARRYSADYLPADLETQQVSAFKDVHHSVHIEGGAVLVEAERHVEILQNFAKSKAREAYLPIALISYLEFLALTGMSQGVSFPINLNKPKKAALEHSVNYTRRLFNFRLNFRFSQLSYISMHNQIFAKWREAFQIDKTLEEVTGDVNEISSYLEQVATQRRERFERDISAAGIAFASIVFIDELFGVKVTNLFDGLSGGKEWLALGTLITGTMVALALVAKNHLESFRK